MAVLGSRQDSSGFSLISAAPRNELPSGAWIQIRVHPGGGFFVEQPAGGRLGDAHAPGRSPTAAGLRTGSWARGGAGSKRGARAQAEYAKRLARPSRVGFLGADPGRPEYRTRRGPARHLAFVGARSSRSRTAVPSHRTGGCSGTGPRDHRTLGSQPAARAWIPRLRRAGILPGAQRRAGQHVEQGVVSRATSARIQSDTMEFAAEYRNESVVDRNQGTQK